MTLNTGGLVHVGRVLHDICPSKVRVITTAHRLSFFHGGLAEYAAVKGVDGLGQDPGF